ncbi:hypothetical protein AMTRI_Chr04g185460 [Amborella trichopoda]
MSVSLTMMCANFVETKTTGIEKRLYSCNHFSFFFPSNGLAQVKGAFPSRRMNKFNLQNYNKASCNAHSADINSSIHKSLYRDTQPKEFLSNSCTPAPKKFTTQTRNQDVVSSMNRQ